MPHSNPRTAATIVILTRTALAASNVPSAVAPMLDCLVEETAAVGAAYFESGANAFFARTSSGAMPVGAAMDLVLAHGLPHETPLLAELAHTPHPVLIDNTSATDVAVGFPELGVPTLAAAPVMDPSGALMGAFLMHCFEPHVWTDDEASLFAAITGTMAALTARLVAEERAVKAQEGALKALGLALEYRDGETMGHTDRVTNLAERTGRALGLSEEEIVALRWGAYLHDIGKIGVPDAILHKPGRLDAAEWDLMRKHSTMGAEFALRLPFLPASTHTVIRYHHERWDGAGYPDGICGSDIPLPARIFSVCDVYDALVSERPYKRAWSHGEAIAEIHAQAGRQFDPMVVDAFIRAVDAPVTLAGLADDPQIIPAISGTAA